MDLIEFSDKINVLSARIRDLKEHATTEESTKIALINPFLQVLGYDTSDPRVVCFEFIADTGTKKGEKVDYAIKRDNEIIMLIEAKKAGGPLDANKANQLHRYFHNTSARIAILTNGICYEFYSDLDKENVMDEKPFMIFDFENVDERLVSELRKLANENFNVDAALVAAQDLKHMRQIKNILKNEFHSPSDEFIKLIASKIVNKPMRANIIDDFREKVKKACNQYINEELVGRIQGVTQAEQISPKDFIAPDTDNSTPIITTEEELEAFLIIKSILRKEIPLSRIAMRDAQTYCGILFDDNNRKPICRFHFNSDKVKYISIFNANKESTKIKIDGIDDIYQYSDEILQVAKFYME